MFRAAFLLAAAIVTTIPTASAQVTSIWLTHRTNDPVRLVVNWETANPGNSIVHFGATPEVTEEAHGMADVTLHHVEIPFGEGTSPLYYAVETGGERSTVAAVKRYGGSDFRAAVVADWQARPDLSALLREEPHLLIIAGDQIGSLHQTCGAGVKDCVKPFATLVAKYPALFRSVPVMPALGNHDREIRPRGAQPPPEPAYDVDATAYLRFYPLPDDGWKWRFEVPAFGLRFIALDLEHTSDFGTTWQTGHDFHAGSAQFEWYRELVARRDRNFVVTIHNERNATMRGYEKGEWERMFRQGTAVISGFGYFAERAEVEGIPYFNTALGTGAKYPDPHSKFFHREASYVLLKFTRGGKTMAAEIKNLKGETLDRSEWAALLPSISPALPNAPR